MNKDLFIKYVYLINRLEESSLNGEELSISAQDKKLIEEVKRITSENSELHSFLEKLHSLDSFERMKAVEDKFYTVEDTSSVEEEEISKTFGVDVSEIKHLFLQNGHEIFYFYDSKAGRNVVLENQKKGESLVEQLKKLQEENEKYQFEEDSKDTKDMLVAEGQVHNMELEMQSKDEILSQNLLDKVDDDNRRLLKHLLENYEELQIDSINVENMIFMDKSGNIKEVSIDKDNNINVGSPSSASYRDGSKENISEGLNTTDTSLEEDSEEEKENEEENDYQYIEGKIDKKDKPKVLVKSNSRYPNSQGYINSSLIFTFVFAVFLYLSLGIILFGNV